MRSNHRCHSKLVRARSTPTFSLMHLLVPGAYRPAAAFLFAVVLASQCTFWCRVLTDFTDADFSAALRAGLNAPSGAGCLPTLNKDILAGRVNRLNAPSGAGCLPTHHLPYLTCTDSSMSQCTFWCRVLTDKRLRFRRGSYDPVSMHLLVPGAYRQPGS